MTRKRNIIITAAALVFVAWNTASAGPKGTVAVLSFKTNNAPVSYGDIVRNQFEVSLYKTGAFTILEREQMDRVLREQGLQQTGCTDASCAVEMGKLLSVDYVIIGSVDKMAGFMLSVKAVSVGKGTIAYADSRRAEKEEDIPLLLDDVSAAMVKGIGIAPSWSAAAGNEDSHRRNLYGWFSLGLGCLGLSGIGTGIYFNVEVNYSNDRYDKLADQYAVATDPLVIAQLKRDLINEKEKGDDSALYRNISYGLGGAAIAASLYFLYRFIVTGPAPVKEKSGAALTVTPVLYSTSLPGKTIRGQEQFFGLGMYIRL